MHWRCTALHPRLKSDPQSMDVARVILRSMGQGGRAHCKFFAGPYRWGWGHVKGAERGLVTTRAL